MNNPLYSLGLVILVAFGVDLVGKKCGVDPQGRVGATISGEFWLQKLGTQLQQCIAHLHWLG